MRLVVLLAWGRDDRDILRLRFGPRMSFEAEWLAARAPYDEAALDRGAIAQLVAWGASLPPGYAPVVVDLGSGTGSALRRAARWLSPRRLVAYAVDQDAALLAQAVRAVPGSVRPVVGDLLQPLWAAGGPAEGTVDLVVGHALADLLPLDRLAARVAALVRPGGLVHLALAYDGLTDFSVRSVPGSSAHAARAAQKAASTATMIAAFHQHMDRPALTHPTYSGSTAGRRLGRALAAAGLDVLADAPSVWEVQAGDGDAGRRVLARLIRYVAEAARSVRAGDIRAGDDGTRNDGTADALPSTDQIATWEAVQQAGLTTSTLSVRVGHRDVLARRPL